MVFSPDFLSTLERLHLLARRHLTQAEPGERSSSRHGASLEFAEHRPYTPGDEIRYIDWNIYARHGSLFVKEFSAEENVHLVLLVDGSASMKFGSPSKLQAAREIAAAIGYIGLVSIDTVSLYSFAEVRREHRRFLKGKPAIYDLFTALEEIPAEGKTDFRSLLSSPFPRRKGRYLILLITDFYDPAYADTLQGLRSREHQVHVVHLVSDQELNPGYQGRHALLDLESGLRREVLCTEGFLQRYRERFARYCGEVESFCLSHELRYARVRSEAPLEERVMTILRGGGILEFR